jgi:hypothetical protein
MSLYSTDSVADADEIERRFPGIRKDIGMIGIQYPVKLVVSKQVGRNRVLLFSKVEIGSLRDFAGHSGEESVYMAWTPEEEDIQHKGAICHSFSFFPKDSDKKYHIDVCDDSFIRIVVDIVHDSE